VYNESPDEVRLIDGRPHFIYHHRAIPAAYGSVSVTVKQAPRSLSHRAYAMGWAASCSCGHEQVFETQDGAIAHGSRHIASEHPYLG
jgi:hypothetical protein